MSEVHHFTQRVNGGTIVLPVGASVATTTGACIIRLTDLPIFLQMGKNFEFARLNKCTVEFWPKANMQLNQFTAAGALNSFSPSGTFVTAIDQVPIYSAVVGPTFGYAQAASWVNDASNDTNVTSASWVASGVTTSYIRGLQGAKEQELYKKRKMSFYPAFYDWVMTGEGSGDITNVTNTLPSTTSGQPFVSNGSVERKIKKWISINNINSQSAAVTETRGPLYYGPMYAIDCNVDGTAAGSIPLFDIRFKYSISFKRYRGL